MKRLVLLVLLVGCGGGGGGSADGGGDDVDAGPPGAVVYAHTRDQLFAIDPQDGTATLVGAFEVVGGWDVTDLAIDDTGAMYATDQLDLFTVDPSTGAATLVRELGSPAPDISSGFFNSLGFADDGRLYAATSGTPESPGGELYTFHVDTGLVTLIGPLGDGLLPAGDIVRIGAITYISVVDPPGDTYLATLDVQTGAATIIGAPLRLADLFGMAVSDGKILAFLADGSIHVIEPDSAVVSPLAGPSSHEWFGAASR
jgi:hypothetical protein